MRALQVALLREQLREHLARAHVLRLAGDQRAEDRERRRHLAHLRELACLLHRVGRAIGARRRVAPLVGGWDRTLVIGAGGGRRALRHGRLAGTVRFGMRHAAVNSSVGCGAAARTLHRRGVHD